MPFQSEKQRRYLHANHPEIAKRWEKEYAYGGLLSLGNESIIDTTEEGNDISLVDETETGVSTLFMKKGGQAIGGGTIQGEPRGDRTGFRNPHEETATAGGKSGYGGGSSNREIGMKDYHSRVNEMAKENRRQEEADLAFSRSPASDIEKYDTWEQRLQDIPGLTTDNPYKGKFQKTHTQQILEEAERKQRAVLNKWGLGQLAKIGALLATMVGFYDISLADAIKVVPKAISVNKKDLLTLVKESLPVAKAKKAHIKALEEYKTSLLGKVDTLNPNEMKSETGKEISAITNEINELTQTRDEDDTGDDGPSVAPVTDEIEESTTYAWDMFTPRDQLKKAAYLDKLEEQAAALNPNKDDLIGEETSGLADLFTVKTQQ